MKRAWFFLFLLLIPVFASADTFTKDLYFGMKNSPQVKELQNFLRLRGYFNYPVSTGNYFTVTLDAVKKFQKDYGLDPIGGFFGVRSREIANTLAEVIKSKIGVGISQGSLYAPQQQGGQFSPIASPFQGKVSIVSASGSGDDPRFENIILENRSGSEKIIISGFRVENAQGETFVIPRGYELPGFNVLPRDLITLNPGDRATIGVGGQDKGMNFRENLCTGYFAETSTFEPPLSYSCPQPNVRGVFTYLSDQCLRLLESTPNCRNVDYTQVFDSNCSIVANQHFNYVGCVSDFRSRPDFFSNNWMIWMQRPKSFFRNVHETVTLKDQAGRVVEQYIY